MLYITLPICVSNTDWWKCLAVFLSLQCRCVYLAEGVVVLWQGSLRVWEVDTAMLCEEWSVNILECHPHLKHI